MKTTILISLIFGLIINIKAQTETDFDGNIYNTANIRTQTWMKENLRVTNYNNGDIIPNVINNAALATLSTDAYYHYGNNTNLTCTYGLSYNFYTVVVCNYTKEIFSKLITKVV